MPGAKGGEVKHMWAITMKEKVTHACLQCTFVSMDSLMMTLSQVGGALTCFRGLKALFSPYG